MSVGVLRCPKCNSTEIEYSPWFRTEVCLWYACKFINYKHLDLTDVKPKKHFEAFRETFKKKISVMD